MIGFRRFSSETPQKPAFYQNTTKCLIDPLVTTQRKYFNNLWLLLTDNLKILLILVLA